MLETWKAERYSMLISKKLFLIPVLLSGTGKAIWTVQRHAAVRLSDAFADSVMAISDTVRKLCSQLT